MILNPSEQKWLKDYKQILNDQFPNLVEDIIVFGSKARGESNEDSDLDILIIIQNGDWKVKEEIRYPGYDLSVGTDIVPSILVYTSDEWNYRKQLHTVFHEVIEEEGVSVS